MISRTTKLRWRRLVRQRKRQVEGIGTQTEERLEQHFFKRLSKLANVRRFIASWLLLLILLISGIVIQIQALDDYYLSSQPVLGGIYTEGVIGAFTNANPLYATSTADVAVAELVFSGLMKYGEDNQLSYDLAEKWEVDESGKIYTVTLRPDLQWHDGKPLTAEDVVFTYKTIQNPEAKSPLRINWQGVSVESQGERAIVFTLPNTLSAFPHSLTNGIVPKHHLQNIKPAQLRSIHFNTVRPVGSGPFKWDKIEVKGNKIDNREEQIGLVRNEDYHEGAPKLQRFLLRVFRDEQKLIDSYINHELNAVAGLESYPDEFLGQASAVEYNIPLTSQVMVFFKTTEEPFTDVKVRQALVQATDTVGIVEDLGFPVILSRSPFLPIHVGYSKKLQQLNTDIEKAKKTLDEAGWKLNEEGVRTKDGRPLTFRLYSQSVTEYVHVSQRLQEQWSAIGVDVQVMLQSSSDLQTTVSQHTYDALLYGISLGMDPDVFAFWHSNQATSRSGSWLNFSEYQSETADKSLEAGRTREDDEIRAIKYQNFLKSWRNDAPALALYQPRFLYVTRGTVHNFNPRIFNQASDRYSNVHDWMIREDKVIQE